MVVLVAMSVLSRMRLTYPFIASQGAFFELFAFTVAWTPNGAALFNNAPGYTDTSIISILHYLCGTHCFHVAFHDILIRSSTPESLILIWSSTPESLILQA